MASLKSRHDLPEEAHAVGAVPGRIAAREHRAQVAEGGGEVMAQHIYEIPASIRNYDPCISCATQAVAAPKTNSMPSSGKAVGAK